MPSTSTGATAKAHTARGAAVCPSTTPSTGVPAWGTPSAEVSRSSIARPGPSDSTPSPTTGVCGADRDRGRPGDRDTSSTDPGSVPPRGSATGRGPTRCRHPRGEGRRHPKVPSSRNVGGLSSVLIWAPSPTYPPREPLISPPSGTKDGTPWVYNSMSVRSRGIHDRTHYHRTSVEKNFKNRKSQGRPPSSTVLLPSAGVGGAASRSGRGG